MERGSHIGDHVGGPVPQHPARETQQAFTGDGDLVVLPHVRPPGPHLPVLAAVDLDVHAPGVEVDVAVAATARPIGPHDLRGRLGQAGPAAQPREVDLVDRLGATRDVGDRSHDQRPPVRVGHPRQHRLDVDQADQPLLERGRDDRDGRLFGGRPLRGVDDRPRGHRARRATARVPVVDGQMAGVVDPRTGRQVAVAPDGWDEHVDRAAPGTLETKNGQRRLARDQGEASPTDREQRDPSALLGRDRAGVGHVDRPVGQLPPPRLQPVPDRLGRQEAHSLPPRDDTGLPEEEELQVAAHPRLRIVEKSRRHIEQCLRAVRHSRTSGDRGKSAPT